MLPVLTTARLTLVPASTVHLELFSRLNESEAVMRHVTGRPLSPVETSDEWSRRLGPRTDEARGLGYWTGFLDPDHFVGWWGLGVPAHENDAGEFGFRIDARYWRQGFGSEGGRRVIDYGFSSTDVQRIWAGTATENLASRAALEKLGLRCVHESEQGRVRYEVTRPEWSGQAA